MPGRREGFAVGVLLTATLLGGCSDEGHRSSDVIHRIQIEHVGSLIDDEGPGGSYGGVANLTLLDDERFLFWDHYQPTRIRVYDSNLQLDTVFGQPGEGPGEFRRPRFQGVIGDTLFVYQEFSGRLDLFDKDDYTHLDTRLGRLGNPMALAFSPAGYMVASSMEMSPEGIGLPLREMGTSGEVREAFGAAFPVMIGGNVPFHARGLSFAEDGALWVLPEHEARVERWERLDQSPPTWALDTAFVFPEIEMADPREYVGIPRTTAGEGPSPRFRGISKYRDGPIWMNLTVPHPEWRDRLSRPEDGSYELDLTPETTFRVTRLYAIDPGTGEILASRILDERWMGFVGQGIAYSWDVDEFGIPYIDLWRPRLDSEPAER